MKLEIGIIFHFKIFEAAGNIVRSHRMTIHPDQIHSTKKTEERDLIFFFRM
jgi:hypothetical protein